MEHRLQEGKMKSTKGIFFALGSLALVLASGCFQPVSAQFFDRTYSVSRGYYRDYPVYAQDTPEVIRERTIERPVVINDYGRYHHHHMVHLRAPLLHFDMF